MMGPFGNCLQHELMELAIIEAYTGVSVKHEANDPVIKTECKMTENIHIIGA